MSTLSFTLLADGTSDRVLIPILRWMLLQHHRDFDWIGQTADLHALPQPPQELPERIVTAAELFPAHVLFIHRDAEKEPPSLRRAQVADAVASVADRRRLLWRPVIPVRMTEAWLLISEPALRHAVGNPNGRSALNLPRLQDLEAIPDPKGILQDNLLVASELTGRRRKKFHFPEHRARIPDFISDWSMLLRIPSARALYEDIASLEFN